MGGSQFEPPFAFSLQFALQVHKFGLFRLRIAGSSALRPAKSFNNPAIIHPIDKKGR